MTGMSWADARAAHLTGKQCLWRDGLYVAQAPSHAPHTSILWAWPTASNGPADTEMAGLRIDRAALGSGQVFAATQTVAAGAPLAPYSPADGRVAAFRAAPDPT